MYARFIYVYFSIIAQVIIEMRVLLFGQGLHPILL